MLIGKLFRDYNIKCTKYDKLSKLNDAYPLYLWAYQENYIKNVKKVDKYKYPFLRLKNEDDLPKYKSTVINHTKNIATFMSHKIIATLIKINIINNKHFIILYNIIL